MSSHLGSAWFFAFFPKGIASGILGVLVPLYFVQSLHGSLLDLGVMSSFAVVTIIPASIYLGKLPDKYQRSKPFILASYLATGAILYLMSATRSILAFQVLYVLMNLTNYIAGPATSILIAESYERSHWGKAMGKHRFVEGLAQATGLGLCTFAADALGYNNLLSITPYLVFASFLVALFAIRDPSLYVERFLSHLETPTEDVEALSFRLNSRGGISKSRFSSSHLGEAPIMWFFGIGMILFAFAASNAFTTLPIFLTQKAGFSASIVFGVFFTKSLAETFSYLINSRIVTRSGGTAVRMAVTIRIILVLSLSLIPLLAMPSSALIALIILPMVAFSWSLYSLGTDVITVQYSGSGSLGRYDAMASVGSSIGGFLGGALPFIIGFEPLFIISSFVFAAALVAFIASRT